MKKKPFILGVCGMIASGKSSVLSILKDVGWVSIDADKIVHDLYKNGGAGQRRICDFFGVEFMKKDGSVNRKKLRDVVFKDVKKLKILNKLIHPLVVSRVKSEISKIDPAQTVAIEALYFEKGGLLDVVDKIIFVKRDIPNVKNVLTNERNIPKNVSDAIISEQKIPDFFDAEVVNNSTFEALKKNVILMVDKLINLR